MKLVSYSPHIDMECIRPERSADSKTEICINRTSMSYNIITC